MRLIPSLLSALPLVLASLAASGHFASSSPTPGPPNAEYVELGGYLTRDADIETWYTALYQLNRNFDEVCGDTFCEGDYSNIQSLRFRCSVERHSGVIGQCMWIFAASNEEVRPSDGRILVDEHHWRCPIPLARPTRAADLLLALAGPAPIHAVLPGTTGSIYDGLVDCL